MATAVESEPTFERRAFKRRLLGFAGVWPILCFMLCWVYVRLAPGHPAPQRRLDTVVVVLALVAGLVNLVPFAVFASFAVSRSAGSSGRNRFQRRVALVTSGVSLALLSTLVHTSVFLYCFSDEEIESKVVIAWFSWLGLLAFSLVTMLATYAAGSLAGILLRPFPSSGRESSNR